MSRATVKLVLVIWISSLVVLLACGGQELLDLGGDAGQGAGEGDAAGSGSGDTSRANGNGGGGDGAAFPCGNTVCSAPDVCCVEGQLATATCEPRASCDGGAVTCTALTCPAGSLCCVSGLSGMENAQCIEAGSCPSGQLQACVPQAVSPPPPGYISDCPEGGLCTCDYVTCTCP
jgi:hypothetical protein